MESLPTELLREILLCLPATTVIVAQSVCRSWRTLIGDPRFAREQLSSRVGGGYLVQHSRLISSPTTCEPDCLLTYARDMDTLNGGPQWDFVPLCPKLPYFNYIVQSCDGLVLLVDSHKRYDLFEGLVHLCNPLLGRWITLPEKPVNLDIVQCRSTRFSFNAASGKYKVFVVTWLYHATGGFRLFCDVLSVGTGGNSLASDRWRRAGMVQYTEFFPHFPATSGFRNGIMSGGQLHWVVWGRNGLPSVMSIDVQSERIHFSPNFIIENLKPYHCRPLSINGCLCLVNVLYESNTQKYKACFYRRRRESPATDPSWEQLMIYDRSLDYYSFVISMTSCKEHEMGALLFFDEGDEEFRETGRHLHHNLRTNKIRWLETPRFSGYEEFGLIDYTPSLS